MTVGGVSIVVPAYNEEARLAASLEGILAYLNARQDPHEVFVVDDGSTDRTAEIARSFSPRGVRLLSLSRNRGKGAAVREGVAATRFAIVLVSDADLSTPIGELTRLERELEAADLVIGSRDVAGSNVVVHQPWYRSFAGRTFNRLVRLLAVSGFRDTQCGFKVGRGDVLRSLCSRLTIERFAWDVELLWLALREGHRVVEVGVEWHNDPASRVHFVRDSTRMLLDILRFKWRHRTRRNGTRG